jgi:hypothetical protein
MSTSPLVRQQAFVIAREQVVDDSTRRLQVLWLHGTSIDLETTDIVILTVCCNSTRTRIRPRGSKPFRFLHCWRVLAVEPKWKIYRASNRAASAPQNQPPPGGLPQAAGTLVQKNRTSKPERNKATNEYTAATPTFERTQKRLADATIKMANASQKRARALEEANHYTLFTILLNDLDADAQEFFLLRRAAIVNEMRNKNREAPSSRSPKPSSATPSPTTKTRLSCAERDYQR